MHCPTCGQNYPEGSQRFCDIDGARLISLSDDDYRRGKQQVFSTIIAADAKTGPVDHALTEEQFVFTEIDQAEIDEQMESLFFDNVEANARSFDDASDEFEVIEEPAAEAPRNFGRRVDPYNIPAGHVEVGEKDHPSINNLDFDVHHPEEFIGRLVKGRYKVIEFIGEEDTGFAFLAEDRIVSEKRVVVRLLTGEDLDEITKSIFAEERISLSHMTHPNVVRLFDSGQFVDGTTFLISENVDALTVNDVLHIHGPMTATRAARTIRQAAYALSDVHQDGVLHRDLRPDFLLVSHTETGADLIKISNFGVSDGEPNAENLAYKAPEILDGRIPTIASDIYSLGVIAYQTLTGRTPFKAENAKSLLRRQKAGLKIHPAELRRDIIPAVDYVFDKVLAPDPLRRFVTAREFGDALYSILTAMPESPDSETEISLTPDSIHESQMPDSTTAEDLKQAMASSGVDTDELAWTKRSPDQPAAPTRNWVVIFVIGLTSLLIAGAAIWFFVIRDAREREAANNAAIEQSANVPKPDSKIDGDVPPSPRVIEAPPNTTIFRNVRENLKGDLFRNFIGYSLYYPNDWKMTGPVESTDGKKRGKFLDIARLGDDGKPKEQMLVSYYPSTGTFNEDAAKFPELVKETNETLKGLIPNYQMLSEGETKLNGVWRAYEVKFQASGPDGKGGRLNLWGRRIFVPVARPGIRAGFEITMLATGYSSDVHSVDDVGTVGELKAILETFEPSSN